MILIQQLPHQESQNQESLLLSSLIQNLRAGDSSVLGPHLLCISAIIKSRLEKVVTIEDSESWNMFLLKAYDSLCVELENLFFLVAGDAMDSSVFFILN